MRVVIMGCGRVGTRLAATLDSEGHDVTILDVDAYAFRRLPSDFKGKPIVGNGIDEDTLRSVGLESADAFSAVTQGDNRNIMASEIAKHIFKVPKVICRIYDPIRKEIFEQLGLITISPTSVGADIIHEALMG